MDRALLNENEHFSYVICIIKVHGKGKEVRSIGWESKCTVFRLALCHGKKYGPNTVLGTAKRLTRHFVIFSSSQREDLFAKIRELAPCLPRLFITVSHVFIPTPLPLAPLRHTHSSRTELLFISSSRCCAVQLAVLFVEWSEEHIWNIRKKGTCVTNNEGVVDEFVMSSGY